MGFDRARTWRVLSTATLVLGIVLLLAGAGAVGWWLLILSGVTFAVELVLVARTRRAQSSTS